MTEGHRQRSIRALLCVQPDIAKLGGLRIVGADDGGFGALVACLCVEMRIRRPGLRHVGAPEQKVAGVVPIGTFRHVCLLAPGHRRGRRQVAIPVVERHADTAHQRQIARSGSVRDHRHCGNGRKAEHTVGPVCPGGIGVGGGGDLSRLIPCGAHESALAACFHIRGAQDRVVLQRGPGLDRRHGLAHFPPHLHQPAPDQRVFHAVGGIKIPAIACTTGAAAWFVVGQIGAGARVIRLLGFPGDDPGLYINLPTA